MSLTPSQQKLCFIFSTGYFDILDVFLFLKHLLESFCLFLKHLLEYSWPSFLNFDSYFQFFWKKSILWSFAWGTLSIRVTWLDCLQINSENFCPLYYKTPLVTPLPCYLKNYRRSSPKVKNLYCQTWALYFTSKKTKEARILGWPQLSILMAALISIIFR